MPRPTLLRPLLALAALLFASAFAAAPARAQCAPTSLDCTDPPTVTITPSGGSWTGSADTLRLNVTIQWCASDFLQPSTRSIVLDGTAVTSSFSYTSGARAGCLDFATSAGTIALGPGSHTLQAQIRDGMEQSGSASGSYAYTYQAPPPPPDTVTPVFRVAVTPDAGNTALVEEARQTVNFTVLNEGNTTAVYALTHGCTGAGLTECARTHAAVTLAAGASATVGVNVKAGQPGSTGSVTLQATRGAVSDGGSVAATVARRSDPGFAGDSLAHGRIERGMCLTVSVGEGAAYECGDLRLAHGLPGVRVLGTHRAPVLLYNSQHANPFPVVATDFSPPADRPTPTQVELTITGPVAGTDTSSLFAGWAPGSTRRIAVGVDASSLETGVYPYRLEVVVHYADGTRLAFPQPESRMVVVNRGKVGSPFGRGWWLAGLEQMVEVSTTERLWVGGDGSARLYRRAGTGPWVAPGLTGPPDTLVARGDTLVRVVRPGRAEVHFDANGRHVRTVSRLGHRSEFTWNAAGRLARVSLPRVPGVFDTGYGFGFEYAHANAVLSRVTAPGPVAADVATTVRVDASGRVTRFINPAGDSVAFGYGSTARVVTRTDALGYRTEFRYNGGMRVRGVKLHMARPSGGDSIVTQIVPQESRGLANVGGPVEPRYARTLINGPRLDTLDYTLITVDRWGAPVRIQNAHARITEIGREDPRFPGLVTRVKHPNGRTVWATYDARGNLASTLDPAITSADGRFATTLYEWDGKWDVLLRSTLPEGESTAFGYDALGRPEWVRPAGDPAREVRYEYHPLTDTRAPGLVAAVTQPLSVREEYGYDVRGNLELSRVLPRGGDPTGALTIHTTYQNDRVGRVTRVVGASGEVQVRQYDILGRDTLSMSIGPQRTVNRSLVLQSELVLPSDTMLVRTRYDLAGQVLSVARWARPDSTGVGTVTTQWTYDAAGRRTAEIGPDGVSRDTMAYDPAGNVVWSRDRRGVATRMRYDALNRVIQTMTDSVSYPKLSDTYSTSSASTTWYFPFFEQDAEGNFGTTRTTGWSWFGVVLRGDTATFAYDLAGNLVRADNRDALVRRSYDAAGRLIQETQKVRTYAGRDTTKYHVYTLGYGYDLNGRRTWLSHPAGISLSGAVDTTRYVYHRATGALDSVAAPRRGAEFFFDYDVEGRLTRQTRDRVVETFHYDPLGRLERRLETSWGTTVHADTLFHDLRGKTVAAHTNLQVDSLAYSGLGALGWVYGRSRTDSRDKSEEEYRTDALTHSYTVLTRSLSPEAPAMDASGGERGHVSTYQAGTGRLLSTYGGTSAGQTSTAHAYDAAGNRTRTSASRAAATPYGAGGFGAILTEISRSYYGGDGRLRVVDRRTCLGGFFDRQVPCDTTRAPAYEDRAVFEEYRYDALGRRVMVRSRAEWACTSYCRNAVMRTVWDGDQVLYEISAPGGSGAGTAAMEADTGHTKQLIDDNNVHATRFFPHGRVMYLHGGSLDAPLAFYRMEYSDSLPGPHRVIPHANWRGSYDSGNWNGTCKVITVTDMLTEPAEENPDPDNPDTWYEEHCLEVFWPAQHLWSAKQFRVGYNAPRTWMGSLIMESRDASGLYYRRNRFYDAETGQFTQEDPIGIAGGLNVYGFADGDPVSYSDPYGLCPEKMKSEERKCDAWNQKQVRRAVEIAMQELLNGNEFSTTPFTERLEGFNEDYIRRVCRTPDGVVSPTGCAMPDGSIAVNADRNPAAISSTLIHETQHVLYWGMARGSEGCATWRAARYVQAMSRENRRSATSGNLPANTSVPYTRAHCQ